MGILRRCRSHFLISNIMNGRTINNHEESSTSAAATSTTLNSFSARNTPDRISTSAVVSPRAAHNPTDCNSIASPCSSTANVNDDGDSKYYSLYYELGYDKGQHVASFRGTLLFALRYDCIHRVLMLHMIRASNLPAKNGLDEDPDANKDIWDSDISYASERGGTRDPYVKIHLLPDRRNSCKTHIHRKTLNAEFNEMFSFAVPYSALSSSMLQFTVYDFDRITRHDLIGNVIMRDLFEKSNLYAWTEYSMHIVGSDNKDDYGDLLLYLSYMPEEDRMNVTVTKAFNLRPMDITGASDPYVKIYHLLNNRRVRKKRTSMKRANLNPVFNESIIMDIPPALVDQSCLLIKVMDWDRIGHDDLLGCAVLGPDSPTEEGRSQWIEAVAHPRRCVGRWHSLLADVPPQYSKKPPGSAATTPGAATIAGTASTTATPDLGQNATRKWWVTAKAAVDGAFVGAAGTGIDI